MTQSTVLVSLDDGRICEYDIASGKPRNTSPDLGGIPFGAPLTTQDGWVFALESGAIVATTGQLAPKWRFIPPSGTFGFQGVQSIGRGISVAGESMLYRLDAASGLVNWSADLGERGCVTPTVTAGLAVSAAPDGGITCLDATTGKLRWRLGPELTGSVSWSGSA
jgi:outer membrane protein assembly factor BamB